LSHSSQLLLREERIIPHSSPWPTPRTVNRSLQSSTSYGMPVIELAREARVVYLIAHNVRDVRRAAQLGVRVLRPAEFLDILRQTK
jgi:hypothetical protein